MYKPRTSSYIIIILAVLLISIASPVFTETIVKIPQTINLSPEEIKNRLPKELKNKDYSIEILVYYFTDSVQTLNFTEESGMSEYESDGSIKAILKIRKKNRIVKTDVIKKNGSSRDNIIKKLVDEINRILAEQNLN